MVSKLAMERADALALIGQIQAQEQCEVLISGAEDVYKRQAVGGLSRNGTGLCPKRWCRT